MTWDKKYTDKRILTLHPLIRESITDLINEADEKLDIKLRVTDAFRSFKAQDKLYLIGRRDIPKEKPVTWVKGGYSAHNYGLAVDVVEIIKGRPQYKTPLWNMIANLFNEYEFDWGFKLWKKDKPHFQDLFHYTIDELRKMYFEQKKAGTLTENKYVKL